MALEGSCRQPVACVPCCPWPFACDLGSAPCRRGECIDGDERCAGWAAEGECKKNPGYMLTTCRSSCHSCSPASAGDGGTSES